MKRIITICLLLAGLMVKAQTADKNTWIASSYLFADEKPGMKRITNQTCIVAFNESAVAFYCKETGLVMFNYVTVPNYESDTLKNVVFWRGESIETKYSPAGAYVIKFHYGKNFEIQQTTGEHWFIVMEGIKRSDELYSDIVNKYKVKN